MFLKAKFLIRFDIKKEEKKRLEKKQKKTFGNGFIMLLSIKGLYVTLSISDRQRK